MQLILGSKKKKKKKSENKALSIHISAGVNINPALSWLHAHRLLRIRESAGIIDCNQQG